MIVLTPKRMLELRNVAAYSRTRSRSCMIHHEELSALLAVVEAARAAWMEFCAHGGEPVQRTDSYLPKPYWSPAGRMIDTEPMVAIRDALAWGTKP